MLDTTGFPDDLTEQVRRLEAEGFCFEIDPPGPRFHAGPGNPPSHPDDPVTEWVGIYDRDWKQVASASHEESAIAVRTAIELL
jgi:hypothetical protein